ncbi:MAG: divalent-cation tolerance protein CutA [Candidatus Aenigmatarchaeota archaeon]
MTFCVVYITTKNLAEARKISKMLVQKKLVACANIIPKIESMYMWKGKVRYHNESLIICKTMKTLRKRVVAEVKKIHDYDVPCVTFLDVDGGNPEYLRWVEMVTK